MEETKEPVRILTYPSISEEVSISKTRIVPKWQKEIVNYLENGVLPSDKKLAVQLRIKAARFTMVNGTLYKRGFMLPLLKCISNEEGDYVHHEIREGICGSHLGARMLANKAIFVGFYWPHMSRDSVKIIKNCDKCQRFTNITKEPPEELSSISSSWPFSQ
jgi:hypothetical protein